MTTDKTHNVAIANSITWRSTPLDLHSAILSAFQYVFYLFHASQMFLKVSNDIPLVFPPCVPVQCTTQPKEIIILHRSSLSQGYVRSWSTTLARGDDFSGNTCKKDSQPERAFQVQSANTTGLEGEEAAMVQYVITPWRHQSELIEVREKLYGNGKEVAAMRDAVDLVGVWMQRGNCPHLVESTALLVAAVLNDRRGGNSTYCVRAAYGGAFSRFVTGLLDGHQVKQKKMSMYSIAKSIGLPATYVELRHQATHEELPSLSKLRTATQKALNWIWDYYWVKLTIETAPAQKHDCKAFVRRIVQETDQTRRSELESKLGGWDEDELLMALLEIQWSSKDPAVLLRCVNLHKKITKGDSTPKPSAKSSKSSTPMSKLEKMRAEMAAMDEGLDEVEADIEPVPEEREDMDVDEPSSGKGWSLWQGPWIPKPIVDTGFDWIVMMQIDWRMDLIHQYELYRRIATAF
ncbi:hypothetical protein GLAREA_00689 [Glarea lozoyensis ATCC 20868]|uniref:Uncharacterized protein n=1 Tax=Glarea lozoyensis (strain ATCC 20868 / MF5171) TaxID=1116229 RepID=S3CX70_GLAL2|nr:uncharacterized protein GLAREA_00689 [Glarea lozoyensis ATCC 20868]EPE29529.1 hypothetical protein GLAREA_00689 [Glarea lozoyensis ATCC 20868]